MSDVHTPEDVDPPAWMKDAFCADYDTRLWFPTVGPSPKAIAVCGRCWVREACLEYALANPDLQGIWAGTSARERGRMRRRAAA